MTLQNAFCGKAFSRPKKWSFLYLMNPWLIYLILNVIVRLKKKYLMQAILLIRYLSVFLVSNARKKMIKVVQFVIFEGGAFKQKSIAIVVTFWKKSYIISMCGGGGGFPA